MNVCWTSTIYLVHKLSQWHLITNLIFFFAHFINEKIKVQGGLMGWSKAAELRIKEPGVTQVWLSFHRCHATLSLHVGQFPTAHTCHSVSEVSLSPDLILHVWWAGQKNQGVNPLSSPPCTCLWGQPSTTDWEASVITLRGLCLYCFPEFYSEIKLPLPSVVIGFLINPFLAAFPSSVISLLSGW